MVRDAVSVRDGRNSRLIFDEPQRVADWCRERLPNYVGWSGHYQAIGYERGGKLLCGVVYTDASPSNVIMSAVIEAPITKRFLYVCFFYPFVQLGVRHVTALVETRNAKSRKLCERLGFVVEGLMREAAKEDDVFVYGMIRRECRFL